MPQDEQSREPKNGSSNEVLLREKARSVIDAVLALNRLGSDDDETDTTEPETASHSRDRAAQSKKLADAEGPNDLQTAGATPPKPSNSLYWLSDDLDDFNGLTFPQKMHHVLRSGDDEDAIAWLPSGRSFAVRDQKKFSEYVLPKYFGKNVAYTSFTRRLVRWGWQNIAKGTYFCKNFTRDQPERCLLMTYNAKVSNKSAGGGGESDPPSVQQLEVAVSGQDTLDSAPTLPPIKRRRDSGSFSAQNFDNWLPKTEQAVAAASIAASRKADPLNLELQSQLHRQFQQQQQFLLQAQNEQRILAQTQQFAREAGIPLHALFPNLSPFANGAHDNAMQSLSAKTHSANVNTASFMLNNMELAKQGLVGTGEIMTPLKLELMKKQMEVDELRRHAAIEEINMRKALDDAIQMQRNAGQLPRPNAANNANVRQGPNNGKKKGPSWVTDNARAA